jgi:hypothetical protein
MESFLKIYLGHERLSKHAQKSSLLGLYNIKMGTERVFRSNFMAQVKFLRTNQLNISEQ